ncbi:MAG: class I SAM-dependent methyltransferase [Gemmatimonadetes bacterium]|nr:class I SAM-dependent methyltransferase [Gemmatimonadota bacterium]
MVNPKRYLPWWAKVGTKVVLSRVPARYRFWQKLNLFVHGQMDRPDYALSVVRLHLARVGWSDLQDRVVLELGPGDSLATAVIAKAMGARQVILVDAGSFAARDLGVYRALAAFLREQGYTPPAVEDANTLDDLLKMCHARYLTRGLHDLRSLGDGLADLSFSQAVLEHVRRSELEATLRELLRVTAPGGVTSHQVDLRDHLGGALNSLRFSDRVWEAEWMATSGFYTNRVRYRGIAGLFERVGWHDVLGDPTGWSVLPTVKRKMASPFREMADEDLLISQFDITARRGL